MKYLDKCYTRQIKSETFDNFFVFKNNPKAHIEWTRNDFRACSFTHEIICYFRLILSDQSDGLSLIPIHAQITHEIIC